MRPSVLPNILSITRLVATFVLYPLLLGGFRTAFFILFVITGITDALDGFLARRLKAQSSLGARLDSIGDYLFFGSVPVWIMLATPAAVAQQYIVPIVLVAIVSALYILVRINAKPTFFHLPTAKLATISMYVSCALILWGYTRAWPVWLAVSLVILAEIEELAVIAGINAKPRRSA